MSRSIETSRLFQLLAFSTAVFVCYARLDARVASHCEAVCPWNGLIPQACMGSCARDSNWK